MWSAVMRALVFIALVGCSAERPGGDRPDAAVEMVDELLAPVIDNGTPTATPNDTVAIRGMTSATTVVVKGSSGEPVIKPVLPTGGFCIDAPLLATGPTQLDAYALKDGKISPPASLTITKDALAPIPSSPKCAGTEAPLCVAEDTASGNCTNGKDDDCNGFADACESGCNRCVDDGLSPNWSPFFVPMITAGTYPLSICPCRDDWFAFPVAQGQVIHVKATFANASIDIDMKLQTVKDAQDNAAASVASSATTTGVEELTWTATAAGVYYLKVFSYNDNGRGSYTLQVF